MVTGPNDVKVGFEPTVKGLYACNAKCDGAASKAWAFINLASERQQEYTKRKYRDAFLARKVQNIIMFPSLLCANRASPIPMLFDCSCIGPIDGNVGCRDHSEASTIVILQMYR